MNKKVITILILTLIALAVLYLYSFGPWAGVRGAGNFNPASLQPSQLNQTNNANSKVVFNSYHNKDLKENYYTVEIPANWQATVGKNPGSYTFSAPSISAQVGLMEVPDNSTLELYVLSQDEPQLKQSLSGYKRISYQKTSVNGNEAYQLIYVSQANGVTYQTIREYIAGLDHAGLINLSAKQQDFQNLSPAFNSIIGSFNWKNK